LRLHKKKGIPCPPERLLFSEKVSSFMYVDKNLDKAAMANLVTSLKLRNLSRETEEIRIGDNLIQIGLETISELTLTPVCTIFPINCLLIML
jgi:hypothetical protein